MALKKIKISDFSLSPNDSILIDNSVWMYLFCPIGNHNQAHQKVYSGFVQSAKSSNATLLLNSLILSEFANRYFRMDFELWKKEKRNYGAEFKREYVRSERYKTTAGEVRKNIKSIVRLCERTTDNFNTIQLDHVLSHIEEIDFNDSYLIELAKIYSAKIVTDDRDFFKIAADITVISFSV